MNRSKRLPAVGKCFDHLGGRLAPIIFQRLIEMKWIEPKEGRKTVFDVTEQGKAKFKEIFDIDVTTEL